MQYQSIELSQIPQPDIVQALDYDAVLAELVAEYKSKDPEWNAEVLDDPILAVLHVAAYLKVANRGEINDAARAVMVASAVGGDLENLAAIFNLKREIITAATDDADAVYENDDRLRKRVLLAPEGYTNAGSKGAYMFWALTCNQVKDVLVMRYDERVDYVDEAKDPRVYIALFGFMENAPIENDVITAVSLVLNDDEIRPLTDLLVIEFAEIIDFSVTAQLKLYAGASPEVILQKSLDGLNEYLNRDNLIGSDITLSGLHAAMTVEGVERVVISEPIADIPVSNIQAAFCEPVNIALTWELYNA